LSPSGGVLVYSTFLGGNDLEYQTRIALDHGGAAYVVGSTMSADFPSRNALQTKFGGGALDICLLKISDSTIVEPSPLRIGTTRLGFDFVQGMSVPASQTVSVMSERPGLTFAVVVATAEGSNWLSALASTPAAVTVSVAPAASRPAPTTGPSG
jgi:hypothetical protein